MRVLVLSDLHDDFWAESGRDPFGGLERLMSGLDHVLLAGDVSNKPKVRWRYAFERLSRMIPLERVSVFPGNHDFYGFRIDGEERLRQIAESHGVSYVQKREVLLGDARILCATLWTDFELGAGAAANVGVIRERMNDYRMIRVASRGYGKLAPSDVLSRHRDHLAWLSARLAEPFGGRTYVATHHAPHHGVLRTRTGGLDAAYASDLSALIASDGPVAWFFGHSHDAIDMTLAGTALRNVSLGYPDEVTDPGARIASLVFEL